MEGGGGCEARSKKPTRGLFPAPTCSVLKVKDYFPLHSTLGYSTQYIQGADDKLGQTLRTLLKL
jgi:hypothetical protein